MKKIDKHVAIVIGVIVMIVGLFVIPEHNRKKSAYEMAFYYLEKGDTSSAYGYFLEADDYKDAEERAKKIKQDDMDALNREFYRMIHAPAARSSSSASKNSSKNSSSSNTSNTTKSNSTSKSYSSSSKNSNKKSSSDGYDDGYDSVYMDEDYDWDRYQNDDDYARGVDDAMEDMDEDW